MCCSIPNKLDTMRPKSIFFDLFWNIGFLFPLPHKYEPIHQGLWSTNQKCYDPPSLKCSLCSHLISMLQKKSSTNSSGTQFAFSMGFALAICIHEAPSPSSTISNEYYMFCTNLGILAKGKSLSVRNQSLTSFHWGH